MNLLRTTVLFLAPCLFAAAAYAGWDAQCVEACVSTHHECHYCDYQCWRDEVDQPEYETGDSYRCPLQGFD